MADKPATYTYVLGRLSWLLDYGEQIADPNVITTAKGMCEEVRELEAAHKAVEADLASETRWAAQYKAERDDLRADRDCDLRADLRLAVAMLAEATAQEVPNRLVSIDEPAIDALRTNINEMAKMIRALRERALVAEKERDDLAATLKERAAKESAFAEEIVEKLRRAECDRDAARDAVASWQSAFEDANAALAAICNLLGIDYHRAMEPGDNPPANIVEAVRGVAADIHWDDDGPEPFMPLFPASQETTGLALWQAARERMAPPLHEQIAAIGDGIPAADLDALPPFDHNAKEATT
jgi:hypothetical protein